MKKGILLALLLGARSAQGQEIVRKGGKATGVDAEVKDLAITPGMSQIWKIGALACMGMFWCLLK